MSINANFYDIESLSNVFTLCNYKPKENSADIYYLCDDAHLTSDPNFKQLLLDRIHQKNHNFDGDAELHDLRYEIANRHLAKTFGLSDAYLINDPKSNNSYSDGFRIVCDSDPDYDPEKHPYLMGYNSYNYDTSELAMYLYEVFPVTEYVDNRTGEQLFGMTFKPASAKLMRDYNNDLFLPRFKESMPTRLTQTFDFASKRWSETNYSDPRWRIRKNMMLSGRHIDVARLNEKQSKVGLKRLLGMLGHQILESDKLATGTDRIDTMDQLLDLIAYNMSDCVNLEELFNDGLYQAQFSLKKALLESYPELIYEQMPNEYKPDIRPEKVRRDRLCIDSSSAQLATKSLCPYGHLKDIPVVSFMYPSERKAKELGIKQVNVLEESKKFFYSHFTQPEIRAKFDIVYNYYKSVEGKNFNTSKNYEQDYKGTPEYQIPYNMAMLPKGDMCVNYYKADGTPSSCFVTFSIGGIHGAEYNEALYKCDADTFEKELSLFQKVQAEYPDPLELKRAKCVIIDGEKHLATKFLKAGSTLKSATYKDVERKRPILFKPANDGSTKLNPKYVFTSSDLTNHEDFTSYYPNLLRMLSAYFNAGLGYDRYAEIFENKQKYGDLAKDKSLTEAERDQYNILKDGTKLILNSASGASDATFDSNIRMNNVIISMRIIGQLFSWRIGQAQTVHGAKVTSTNTDGLYSALDAELNNKILEKESADIGVEIEPEPVFLISKDTNNRIEMDPDNGKVTSASGGTLGCRKGPNPTKSLNHPAIIDWALTEYLIFASMTNSRNATLTTPFNQEAGMHILLSAKDKFEPIKFLQMMQNIIASSIGSMNYIFGTTDSNPSTPIMLQHYNRTFIMKDKTPKTMHIHAANAKQITPATMNKRRKEKARPQQHDPISVQVLSCHGVSISDLPITKEAVVKKVTNVDESWYMLIENKALNNLTDAEINYIIDNLDFDKYLELLSEGFEKNWRNKIPDVIEIDTSDIKQPAEPVTVIAPETNTKEVTDYINAGLTDCVQVIANAENLFPCNEKDKEQINTVTESLQSLMNTR